MVFFTLWLQLLGFSDFAASLLMAVFAGGCAVGSLLGGAVGAHINLKSFLFSVEYFLTPETTTPVTLGSHRVAQGLHV